MSSLLIGRKLIKQNIRFCVLCVAVTAILVYANRSQKGAQPSKPSNIITSDEVYSTRSEKPKTWAEGRRETAGLQNRCRCAKGPGLITGPTQGVGAVNQRWDTNEARGRSSPVFVALNGQFMVRFPRSLQLSAGLFSLLSTFIELDFKQFHFNFYKFQFMCCRNREFQFLEVCVKAILFFLTRYLLRMQKIKVFFKICTSLELHFKLCLIFFNFSKCFIMI